MLIVCNGMPRSGSTLVYNLVRIYLIQTGGVKSLGFFGEEELAQNTALFEQSAASKEIYVLKTHYAFDRRKLASADRVLEFYTIRDPRRIGASMMRIWHYSEEKVIEVLQAHMRTADSYNVREETVFLRYEDLEAHRTTLFDELSTFVRRPYAAQAGQAAVQRMEEIRNKKEAFGRLKPVISRSVWGVNRYLRAGRLLKLVFPSRTVAALKNRMLFVDKETMLHPGHVGRSDAKIDLSSVTRSIETRFAVWMAAHGYGPDAAGK